MSFEYELEDEFEKNSGTPTPKGGFKTSKNDYENTTNNFAGEKNKLNSLSKKVAKSSINFQKVNIHAFKHNAREEEKKLIQSLKNIQKIMSLILAQKKH